uniref:Uncharacterized protein n=1 Tax=Arion vulgaris TaxID=1028688 RepID=A0A0B7AHY0_9EUPU
MFPKTWVPLYTMVSFTRIRYHDCVLRKQWQDKILMTSMSVAAAAVGGLTVFGTLYALQQHSDTLNDFSMADLYDAVRTRIQGHLNI